MIMNGMYKESLAVWRDVLPVHRKN